MPVPVTCPSCAASLRAPDNAAGRKLKCPKCGGIIPVASAGEEVVDLAKLNVRAETPGPAPAAAASRPRHVEEDDDAPRRSRRRREYEDDDDYDDEPGYSRRAAAPGGGLQLGLGIA